MKRLICFILTVCIIIANINIIADATPKSVLDVNFEYNLNVLKALGFLDDGFNKENALDEVTRGQAVDAIVKMCSFDTVSNDKYTYFSDVTSDSSYLKSINYAVENGITTGYDGLFEPEKTVTPIEAITFIMRATGYKTYAEVNGGYPAGYMKAAKMSGLNFSGDTAFTKADFIRLLFTTMHIDVYEQKTYGLGGVFESSGKSVIEYFHDIYKVRGQVTSTFASSLTKKEIGSKKFICIDGNEYKVENGEYSDLLGYYVEAYYYEKEDTVPTVLFMAKDPKYDVLIINADEITGFSNLKYTYGEKNRSYANIATKHNLIVNGIRLTDYSEKDFVPENGYVVLIGEDNSYDTVIVNSFRNYFLERMAVGVAESITLTDYETLRRFEIALNDDEKIVDVYVDNEKIDMKPFSYTVKGEKYNTYTFVGIPEGSVASIFADKYEEFNGWIIPAKGAKIVKIYVNTPKITGTCVSYDDTQIIIDGTEYEISKYNELGNLKIGDGGYFVLDYDGKVSARYDNRYTNDTSYAYLINAVLHDKLDKELKIKIMTDNGKIKIYTVTDKIKFNGKMEKDLEKVFNSLSKSAKLLDPSFTISQPVKVRLDKYGEICEIQTVSESDTEFTMQRDGERSKYTSRSDNGYMLYSFGTAYYLAPKIMFEVPNTETFDDEDYRIMMSWSPDYESKVIDVFDVNVHRVPELVVSYVGKSESTLHRPLMMVSKVIDSINEDGCFVQEVIGYDGYDKVYYYSENLNLFDKLKEGDVIKVYGKGEKVTSWDYICKIDDVINHNFSESYGRQTDGLYEVYSLKDSYFALQHDEFLDGNSGKRKSQIGFLWNDDSQSFKNGAVYYDGLKGKNKVSSFQINSGVPKNSIQTVQNVGNEKATKIYIKMENGMIKFVAFYNGLGK